MNQLSIPTITQDEHQLMQEAEAKSWRHYFVPVAAGSVIVCLFILAALSFRLDSIEHHSPPCSEWGWTPEAGKACIRWGWSRK